MAKIKTKPAAKAAKSKSKKSRGKTVPQAARTVVRVVRPSGMQARGR